MSFALIPYAGTPKAVLGFVHAIQLLVERRKKTQGALSDETLGTDYLSGSDHSRKPRKSGCARGMRTDLHIRYCSYSLID